VTNVICCSIAAAISAALRALKQERAYRPSLIERFFYMYSQDRGKVVITAYTKALAEVCRVLTPLIKTANVLESGLESMGEQINAVHDILRKEGLDIVESKAAVHSSLWTMVGWNNDKLRKMDLDLELIGKVDKFKAEAMAHMREVLFKLVTMRDQMDSLRDSASSPQWHDWEFAIEAHIETIESSVRRLWAEVDEGRLVESKVDDSFAA